jgi:sugar phosphate isomerase/epimerase
LEPTTTTGVGRLARTEGLVLYSGTVINASWSERIAAAVAGGFRVISLFPRDYREARTSGLSDADMRAQLEDAGIGVAVVDPYTEWWSGSSPPKDASGVMLSYGATAEEEMFAITVALGAPSVNCLEFWGVPVPAEAGAEAFASACDRAAERGLRLHLEAMPYSGIPDLAASWEMVRLADRPNGGLLVDSWHHYRGPGDNALLASVPGEKVFAVQLADGPPEPVGALSEDSMLRRRLPGEGAFDIVGLLRMLEEIEARPSMGIEVFSEELNALAPQEAGRRSGETMRAVLGEAARMSGEGARGR